MLIRAQFTRNGNVGHDWLLFMAPETMSLADIFEAVNNNHIIEQQCANYSVLNNTTRRDSSKRNPKQRVRGVTPYK